MQPNAEFPFPCLTKIRADATGLQLLGEADVHKALNDGKISESERDAVKHYIAQRQEAGLRYIQEVSARIRPTSLEKAPPDPNPLTSDSAPADPAQEFPEVLQRVQSHLWKMAQAFDLKFETVGKRLSATDCLRGN